MTALLYLALASKEMAVTFPLVIALYEILFEPRRDFRGPFVTGLLCALAAAGKVALSLGKPVGGYGLTITWATFADNWAHYGRLLTAFSLPVSGAAAIAGLVLLFALPIITKDRPALFGALVFAIGAVPVIFAAPRSLCVLFVPFLGLGLWCGSLAYRLTSVVRVLLLAAGCAIAALVTVWAGQKEARFTKWIVEDSEPVRMVLRTVKAHERQVLAGSMICFSEDPFRGDGYGLFFTVSLYFKDPLIRVGRPKDPCPDGSTHLTLK